MSEKIEHQGTVVETADRAPANVEAVVQPQQGLVFKTEDNHFGTLGHDGLYHGYVPSTQVRDILNGAGEIVQDETEQALDLAEAMDAKMVVGSEAALPTGDIDNLEDATPQPVEQTDRDETLAPIPAADTAKANKSK